MLYQWLCLLGALLLFGLLFWLRTRIRYRITDRHVQVVLLGVTVRRLALSNIQCITKRRSGWAENWWSTWRPFRRTLILRRRRGWRKDFVITPRYRYEFKAELERALERARNPDRQSPAGNGRPGADGPALLGPAESVRGDREGPTVGRPRGRAADSPRVARIRAGAGQFRACQVPGGC